MEVSLLMDPGKALQCCKVRGKSWKKEEESRKRMGGNEVNRK